MNAPFDPVALEGHSFGVRQRALARETQWHVWVTAILVSSIFYWTFASRQLSHDIAWLLDASQRWMGGATLYVDVVESNPPLVFYEMLALTFGLLTPETYMLGTCAVILASFSWVQARAGRTQALAALLAMTIGAWIDFGQRDHIAFLFAVPFLMLDRQRRAGEVAVGLWAFLGVGLKPHFVLIPACALIASAIHERSLAPLFSWRARALAAALVAYAGFVAVFHPAYLQEVVPLGLFVYWAYGQPYFASLRPLVLTVLGLYAIAKGLGRGGPLQARLCGALAGALACFYLQGKFWSYHQVPVQCLILLILLTVAVSGNRIGKWACASIVTVAGLFAAVAQAAGSEKAPPVPGDARSVLFLSAHVWSAYPVSLDRGLRQVSRYPALWTLPGAWSIYDDPNRPKAERAHATAVLRETRDNIIRDIQAGKPDYIYEDVRKRKPYFRAPFSYSAFLGSGLSGYRPIAKRGIWRIYARRELKPPSGTVFVPRPS